ncbi:MAG: flagellin-like hook-associated protein FlgL, partial [Candidatus Azotimanducaceae bacterium]
MNILRTNTNGRFLEQLTAMQQRRQERLASGKRIARAADDSAGLAIA